MGCDGAFVFTYLEWIIWNNDGLVMSDGICDAAASMMTRRAATTDPNCGQNINHAVAVVGYGSENGQVSDIVTE